MNEVVQTLPPTPSRESVEQFGRRLLEQSLAPLREQRADLEARRGEYAQAARDLGAQVKTIDRLLRTVDRNGEKPKSKATRTVSEFVRGRNDRANQVLAFLLAQREPVTSRQIYETMPGMTRTSAEKAIRDLRAAGVVRIAGSVSNAAGTGRAFLYAAIDESSDGEA